MVLLHGASQVVLEMSQVMSNTAVVFFGTKTWRALSTNFCLGGGGGATHSPAPLTVNGHKLCFGCTDNKTKVRSGISSSGELGLGP